MKKISRASALLVTVLTGTALWCTGCTVNNTDSSADAVTQQGPQDLIIDETGNGETFEVVEGRDIVVRLPGNPSTGYSWEVATTDKTFGYPVTDSFTPSDSGAGSDGIFEFVWKTDGVLSVVGSHTVTMDYLRSWEDEAIDTFTFTVDILSSGDPGSGPVVVDETGHDTTVDVIEGRDVLLRLAGNPSTGYEWTITSTDKTFGYPASEEYLPSDGAVGSGGVYEFLWKTDGALSMVGAHTVALEYRRSWETDSADTFVFTVNVLAAQQ